VTCRRELPNGSALARFGSTWFHWWSWDGVGEPVDLLLGDVVPAVVPMGFPTSSSRSVGTWPFDVTVGPSRSAQFALEDLAGGGHGEGVAELDEARVFVAGARVRTWVKLEWLARVLSLTLLVAAATSYLIGLWSWV